MIDIKLLEQRDGVYFNKYRQNLINRGFPTDLLDQALALNKKRKELITHAESAKSNQNKMSGDIAQLKKKGEDTTELIEDLGRISASVRDMENRASEVDRELNQLLLCVPNLCEPEVPLGKSEQENLQVKAVGSVPKFSFKPKEHWELGEKLDQIDFARAGKTTGARFAFLRGPIAQLERALVQLMLDMHTIEHGYIEVIPPYIVNSQSLVGTGNFPKFRDDVFHLEGTDYHLIPTAEVPLTNFFANEILTEEMLPQRFVAFSPCFRSEAGSHGRDTKGLIRQHQFHKVELMVYAHPEMSSQLHETLTSHAEKVLEVLELPYRRMLLCTGDISFGAAKCYDLEVWLPGQNSYREISSCSNFGDFQARRANIRFRPKGEKTKPQFVHTMNGSGLAAGRTLIAVLENYQKEDGSIEIPQALRKYFQGKSIIT